jgi:hypothetical protein
VKRLTLSNFSGGQNEVLFPREFSPNQWHHLVGFIINEDGLPRSQYPVQRIGSFPSNDHFYKLHAIVTSVGTFLLAITRLGRLYWCKAPAADATYTTANAVTWTQITEAQNYGYATSGTTLKETLVDNPYLRFICDLPVQAGNYTKSVNATYPTDTSKDSDVATELGEFPGVLISYRVKDNSLVPNPQVLVAYVNTKDTTPSVKVIVFPHKRRTPTATVTFIDGSKENNFINAVFLSANDSNNTPGRTNDFDYDSFPTWPYNMSSLGASEVKMHPYSYTNADGANLSGRGIIPRCNVGCSIQGKIVLGDIEWRKSPAALPTVPVSLIKIADVGTTPQLLTFPDTVFPYGRVVRNEGPGRLLLTDSDGGSTPLPAAPGLSIACRKSSKVSSPANTCIIRLASAPPTTSYDRLVVSGVGPNFDGTFTSFTIDTSSTPATVSYVNPKGPATLPLKARKGKVIFQSVPALPAAPDGYKIEVEQRGYAAIPNSWEYVAAAADGIDATCEVYAYRDRMIARHFYNDDNTGPVRNGVYFSDGAIDEFSPVAEFPISRGGAPIAAMESLDGRVIALTEGGGATDGLYRIRGNLTLQLIEDPTAIAIELIKGGVGAPVMAENLKNPPRRACVWADTSTMIFVDRQGGVYFTDGNTCDRIDRLGPVTPRNVTYASVAAVGRHLFAVRGNSTEGLNKLYCFSVSESDGAAAAGIWTQLSLATTFRINSVTSTAPTLPEPNPPAGHPTYQQYIAALPLLTDNIVRETLYSDISLSPFQLTAGKEDLYFIGVRDADGQANEPDTYKLGSTGAAGGHVYRLATAGPVAEYGRLDNEKVVQYVTTPTIGADSPYESVKYDNFSVEFTTHSSTRIVAVVESRHGGGAFTAFPEFVPNPLAYYSNNVFVPPYTPAGNYVAAGQATTFTGRDLYEIKGRMVLGPSKLMSMTMFLDGDMTLHSMSFWSTAERSASVHREVSL